jgi:cell wall-associated NlpC family hydrolase
VARISLLGRELWINNQALRHPIDALRHRLEQRTFELRRRTNPRPAPPRVPFARLEVDIGLPLSQTIRTHEIAQGSLPRNEEFPKPAPVPSRKANAARHGAELAAFLREREHQVSYCQAAYPDTKDWGLGSLKKLKRQLGGTTHLTLNCWGLVFYAHHRTGNLSKAVLEARAHACDGAVAQESNQHRCADIRLRELRRDLVGNAQPIRFEQVDFATVPPGSTVAFSTQRSPLAHVAIMLDNGQMAHLIQALTSPEALTRPDIAQGTLEITHPAAVAAMVRGMPMGDAGVFVSHTPGPMHFMAPRR